MDRPARLRPAVSGILDRLAARAGLSLSLAALVLMCLLAGLYVERSVWQSEESRDVFSDRQIRNGFMSMTDIQRLVLIVQEAKERGGFTPEGRRALISAADFLYVRANHFRRNLGEGATIASAEEAVRSVEAIVEIADRATTRQTDVARLWSELLAASNAARQALTTFLEEAGRLQNEIMQDQARAVSEQRVVVQASLVGLTFVGIAALMLLRKEVLARQARERAERHVEFLAYFDQLTELPNRAQFQRRLREDLNGPDPVTLALVDLDDFKGVNDTYGHAAGDAVLRHVAGLLSNLAGDLGGLAARLGGDEFAIILPTDDLDQVTGSLDALLQEARKGLSFQGETFRTGLSIGFATSSRIGQDMVPSLDTIFRVADFALYYSKSNGRGRFTRYDRALERRFLERRSMVDDLPFAVASGNLDIYLQPKVCLPDSDVYGFEALVRWQRDGRVVPPDEFIKVAEECGLIYDIDRYVLKTATEVLGNFNRDHGTDYSVSVNLSALHFNSRRVVDWVDEALRKIAPARGLLTLEITETVELRDWRQAQTVMSELRALGAKISIDDFGTGYSSLAYLRSKVVDEVKIDRSIVEQIEVSDEAQFLLDGVLDIAGNLGLDVVVEGVENVEQFERLCRMGAKRAQGYLFGRPLPAKQVLEALHDKTGRFSVNSKLATEPNTPR